MKKSDSGLTLVEVIVSIMISTSLILGLGQIMRSSFGTLNYISEESINLSQMSSLKSAVKDDVEDSEILVLSTALSGLTATSQTECTTATATTGVSGNRTVLPLFSAFVSEVQGRSTSGFKISHGSGYELRKAEDGKSGEIWRVVCDEFVDLSTSETSWKPNLLSSTRLAGGLALPYDSGSAIASKWFVNNFSLGLYGIACISFDKAAQKYVPTECEYGLEYGRTSGQPGNGVRGMVLRIWKANGDLGDDIVVARRLT